MVLDQLFLLLEKEEIADVLVNSAGALVIPNI